MENRINTNSLVSIIIPTYGRAESLITAVQSVINQTYKHIEIIVVDDNGLNTENQLKTKKKITPLQSKFPALHYIPLDKNRGGSFARNTGVGYAKGKFICLLDDDDAWFPTKVERQVELLNNNKEYIACYCSHLRRFLDNGTEKEMVMTLSGNITYELLTFKVDACTGSSLMLYKSYFDKLGGFTTHIKRMQDYEFITRLSSMGKIGIVESVELVINTHNSSYRFRKLSDIIETRKQFIDIVKPQIEMLTESQQKEIILKLHINNIVDAIRLKEYKTAIRLFVTGTNRCKVMYEVVKRVVCKIIKR